MNLASNGAVSPGLVSQNVKKYQWVIFCIHSDACWRDFLTAAQKSIIGSVDREELITSLQKLWTSKVNPNPVLPCLSVRTGLDLYLRVMQFPPGSEVIMSAINIPSMVQVSGIYYIIN